MKAPQLIDILIISVAEGVAFLYSGEYKSANCNING